MQLSAWPSRPTEEANLFNPAFVGAVTYEFVKSYQKTHSAGAPITFLPLVLAAVLHKPTRRKLPGSTITSLYQWVQNNEEVLIGLGARARGLAPYTKEALVVLFANGHVDWTAGHSIGVGKNKAGFPPSFLKTTTLEVKEIVERTKFFARWLAKSGSESTILASWGIRP